MPTPGLDFSDDQEEDGDDERRGDVNHSDDDSTRIMTFCLHAFSRLALLLSCEVKRPLYNVFLIFRYLPWRPPSRALSLNLLEGHPRIVFPVTISTGSLMRGQEISA
jgi:hypothetical protein